MNSDVPPEFLSGIRAHNRQCLASAAASLFFAWGAWGLAYAFCVAMVLLFRTVIEGTEAVVPAWMTPSLISLAGVLLVWAALDRRARRFRPPPDRPIIGWHLLPEALLLPARLTFAIADHLSARVRASPGQLANAWDVLTTIADTGRTPVTSLGAEFSSARSVKRSIQILMLLQWIDLHSGEDGWFYLVRSDRAEALSLMRPSE